MIDVKSLYMVMMAMRSLAINGKQNAYTSVLFSSLGMLIIVRFSL